MMDSKKALQAAAAIALPPYLVWRTVVYFEAERNYAEPPGFWGTIKGILISNQKLVFRGDRRVA